MLVKSFLVALIALILMGWTAADPSSMQGQSKLFELMQSTRDLQQSNPSRSLECFQYYSQVFDAHLKVYETEYAVCKNDSARQKDSLLSKYVFVVDSLNDSSSKACQALATCSNGTNSLDSLACYDSVGGNNTKVMYNVSTTASVYRFQLEHDLESIQYNEDTCTNAAQHKYDRNFNKAYVDLQNCLSGLAPVPSADVSTTTERARRTSTVAPLTLKPNEGQSNSTHNHGIIGDIDNIIHNIEHIV